MTMTSGFWKKFWSEKEPPIVFWPTYIIYLFFMSMIIYYSLYFNTRNASFLFFITICSGVIFPAWYLYRQRQKNKIENDEETTVR